MLNKQKQLRAAIIKAVPEEKKWQCDRCNSFYAEYVNGCPKCATGKVGGSASVYPYVREPTLADCVLALHKNDKNKKEHFDNTMTPETSIDIDDLVNQYWDLTKPYSQQPKETINLLHSLLVS